jgi:hypothetical protein
MKSISAYLLPVCALLLLEPLWAAGAPPTSSSHALENFYRWVLAHPASSVPTNKERGQLSAFLSPHLIALLKDAADAQARCVKTARKDEKPLILEGDLFVGYEGGASEVAYGATSPVDGGTVNTTMHLFAIDKRFAKGTMYRTVTWVDKVQLRQESDGIWRVQDILFEHNRSLVNGLQAYLAEAAESCVVKTP